jgi:hypothetical protein
MNIASKTKRSGSGQRFLFNRDLTLNGYGSCRTIIGDFFEEALASLFQAARIQIDSRCDICPDLLFEADVYMESKGVGRSRNSVLYSGRIAKDEEFITDAKRELWYCFWRHNGGFAGLELVEEVRDVLAASCISLTVVPFLTVSKILAGIPSRVVNSAYRQDGESRNYGQRNRAVYGSGWTLPLRLVQEECSAKRRLLLPVEVYGRTVSCLDLICFDKKMLGRLLARVA